MCMYMQACIKCQEQKSERMEKSGLFGFAQPLSKIFEVLSIAPKGTTISDTGKGKIDIGYSKCIFKAS